MTRRVHLIATIILIGTVLMIGWHYFQPAQLPRPYSVSTFLFNPADRFMDFFNDFNRAAHFAVDPLFAIDYTPWAHFLVTLTVPLGAWLAFGLELLAFGATLSFMLVRYFLPHVEGGAAKVQQFFILAALSYPVIFLIDRGNHEMLVFVLLFWFLHLYYNSRSPWTGVLLAAAIAIKFYPATLLVLLLADRRYRDALIASAAAIGMLLVGVLGVSLTTHVSVASVVAYTQTTLFGPASHHAFDLAAGGVQHGHSLWSVFLVLGSLLRVPLATLGGYSTPYGLACLVLFAIVSVYVIFVERRPWARVLLLVICAITLPFTSADYTLIHLFLPMMMLVAARRSPWDKVVAGMLALLFVPMDFLYSHASEVSTSVIIYPMLLLGLVVATMWSGLILRQGREVRVAS